MDHVNSNEFVTAEVPSNIAFVKYWGKRDTAAQWPANSSLSMTLDKARTVTSARVLGPDATSDKITKDGTLLSRDSHGAEKAYKHLEFLRNATGFSSYLEVVTHNTFPSECGIASSASGLGALTMASVAAWTGCHDLAELQLRGHTLQSLAHMARLGSGSACRSFFGGYVAWEPGASPTEQTVQQVKPTEHWPLADLIVIVSAARKPVSSTVAHKTAWTSPLFGPRLAGLSERLKAAEDAIKNRDLKQLGTCIEADALEMHAVMMTSQPAANYMTKDSEEVISWIRTERASGQLDAWFTMDAGPNVHVICDARNAQIYAQKIKERFPEFALIADTAGAGPVLYQGSSKGTNTDTPKETVN